MGVPAPVAAFFSDHNNPICTGTTVQFTDDSSNSPNSWNWSFPGGTPSSSTDQNPVVVYNSDGEFNVSLIVTNNSGTDTEIESDFILVSPDAFSDFSVVTNNLNSTATFTNLSFDADSYLWDFGDGNTSTEENPIHTYAAPGTYSVTLEAINNCGSDFFTDDVTLDPGPPPNANFFSNHNNPECEGVTISFMDATTNNPESWFWEFPGGTPSTSTDQNPVVVYNVAGSYDVMLTATSPNGSNTEIENDYVIIVGTPDVNFTSATNGLTVNFTNTTNNGSSFSWDLGDGNSSTDENPTHTYATGGTFSVTLTATNSCGSESISNNVVVTPPIPAPVADFTSNHTNPVCGGTVINFLDNSTNSPSSWSWTFPGGTPSTSTDQNPIVTYDTPGTYEVTLTATNATGSNTRTLTGFVVVAANAVSGFSSSQNALQVTFTNSSTNADTYLWDFGDGNTSTDFAPTYTYQNGGTFNVSLTATNMCGSNASTQSVTVVPVPTATFTSNHSNPICGGNVVNFVDGSTGSPTAWNWTFQGGSISTSTDQNPVVTYSNPGTYNVTLTVTNVSGTDTRTENGFVVVAPQTSSSFTFVQNDLNVVFTNQSQNANSFTWNFGDGNTSTDTNPNYTYSNAGTFNVTLTAAGQCGTATSSMSVSVTEPIFPPVADFASNHANPVCGGAVVNFTDNSTNNPTSWNWTFQGGSPSTSNLQNPTVTYSTPGTYPVVLSASNSAGGDTRTLNGFVVVSENAVSGFNVTTDVLNVSFDNISTNATSYQWNFGDGNTSTDFEPNHAYNIAGTYTITLVASNNCGDNTVSQSVTVIDLSLIHI